MTQQEKTDYKETLNLPRTEFPMQARLPQREPVRFAQWEAEGLSARIVAQHANDPVFCLHDGPPYANGAIHIGHALNKILKDVLIRYKAMSGHKAYYRPGFDCHGLPIEQKVLQKLGGKARKLSPVEIRAECRRYAQKWVDTQREEFKRLGVGGDWDNAYLTMSHETSLGILRAFRDLVARGVVRRGMRPNYWDPVFRTVLAEAEIEYATHVSDSIYVKFPLTEGEAVAGLAGLANVSLVIWTTTPWTLPANLAVCLHPDYEYVVLRSGAEHYVVARELAESFRQACGLGEAPVVARVNPRDLERKTCRHPIFDDRTSLIILGTHVTLDAGTGCVHTAPGHGLDDFHVGQQYGLDVFVPVDEAGQFTADFPAMAGVGVFDANPRIIEMLEQKGLLLHAGKIEHQYPHSWRSHKPIIFRATEQWFIDLEVGRIRQLALQAIDQIRWIPEWGRDRIYNMVESRPDWCISRQRAWGVPIPAIRSKATGAVVLDVRILDTVLEVMARKGEDAWWTEPLCDFWPEGFICQETGETSPDQFEKLYDILDVWFDSGATSIAVCEADPNLTMPADLYLEGGDQHRGWFQTSLLLRIAARGEAPFRAAMTHGWVLDGQGEAMSKSKGNVIAPQEIVQTMGADGLRLWVVSEDYRADLTISQDILRRVADAYRRIRNTFKFLIGNLSDFDPERDALPVAELEEFDRWIISALNRLIEKVRHAYERYEFHRIYHLIHNFCSVQLSALYLDVIKDRLYCSAPGDMTRRSAQTACHHLLHNLVRMVAPILVFTADEVWGFARLGPESNVHLASFPTPNESWAAPDLEEKWERLLELRSEVSRVLEEARREKRIGHSLEAAVEISSADEAEVAFLRKNIEILKDLFIVSAVQVQHLQTLESPGRSVTAAAAAGRKCQRCWMIDPAVGQDSAHPGLCGRCLDVIKRIG